MKNSSAARWGAVAIFGLASTWNYLDRLLLSAAAPSIQREFHLSIRDYGLLVSAFSLAYTLASPVTGWLLDRLGLQRGITGAVGLWSLAAILCGWTRSFGQLVVARILLGVFESAGVPAAGKLNSMYLPPGNRAIGAAVTQVGLSIGGVAAPLLVTAFDNWRSPFFLCGALGLLWIPLWTLVRRNVEPYEEDAPDPAHKRSELLRDSRLITLAIANVLWMGIYTLWSNWTTMFLNVQFGMGTRQAGGYAWFPPVASTLGAFAGGWLSRRAIAAGSSPVKARVSAALVAALGCLVTLLVPLAPSPTTAMLAVAASYFWVTAGSVNLYTIPVDIWGGGHAGSAISVLVFAYGLMQTAVSPLIGWLVQDFGFTPVCWLVALPPFGAWLLLRRVQHTEEIIPVAL